MIKLIFQKFALQECSLKTEECRCFLLLKIIGDLFPTSTPAMPSWLRSSQLFWKSVEIDTVYEIPLISTTALAPMLFPCNFGLVTKFPGATNRYTILVLLSAKLVVILRKWVFLSPISTPNSLLCDWMVLSPWWAIVQKNQMSLVV